MIKIGSFLIFAGIIFVFAIICMEVREELDEWKREEDYENEQKGT